MAHIEVQSAGVGARERVPRYAYCPPASPTATSILNYVDRQTLSILAQVLIATRRLKSNSALNAIAPKSPAKRSPALPRLENAAARY